MKTRFLFQLVMLVALSVFAFAVPALAEDAAVSATGIMWAGRMPLCLAHLMSARLLLRTSLAALTR